MNGEVPPPPETPEVSEDAAQEAVEKAATEVGDKDISEKFAESGESAESNFGEEEQLAGEKKEEAVEESPKSEQVKESESIKEDSEHKINWNETNNELPDEIDLGDNVNNKMNELYTETKADGNERAGTFVPDSNGDLKIDPDRIKIGDHNSVTPNYGEPGDIGTVHTHPEGSPPSSADISSAINGGEKLSVVDAGDNVYALGRTENTPDNIDAFGVSYEYDNAVADYVADGHSDDDAMRLANIDLADKYGMNFYEGKPNEELNRIESFQIPGRWAG